MEFELSPFIVQPFSLLFSWIANARYQLFLQRSLTTFARLFHFDFLLNKLDIELQGIE